MNLNISYCLFFLALAINASFGQRTRISTDHNNNTELGNPVLEEIPRDKALHFLNFDVAQGPNGLLYMANGLGVAIYDGVKWELIELPDKSRVFDIEPVSDGKIFIGSMTDLGYFECDHTGKLIFTSLKEKLPENVRESFKPVEYISRDGDAIIFFSISRILIWKNGGFKIIDKDLFGNKLLYRYHKKLLPTSNEGLLHFNKGELSAKANGHFFDDMLITGIEALGTGSWVVATAKSGWYLYSENTISKIILSKSIEDEMEQNEKYEFRMLNNGNFLMVFENGELYILDNDFEEVLNFDSGDSTMETFEDRNGYIWLVQNKRIVKFHPDNPLTMFDARNGILERILNVRRFNDTLFLTSISPNGGISKLVPSASMNNNSEFITDIKGWGLKFVEVADKLIVNTNEGVFSYSEGEWRQIFRNQDFEYSIFSLKSSSTVPKRFYLGGVLGLYAGELDEHGSWILKKLASFDHRIEHIEELKDGTLWAVQNSEITRISFNNKKDLVNLINPKLSTYGSEHGIPNASLTPFKINGELIYSTYSHSTKGTLFGYDNAKDEFYRDTTFANSLGFKDEPISIKYVDEDGNILLALLKDGFHEKYVAWHQNGSYITEQLEVPVELNEKDSFMGYLEAKDSVAWFHWYDGPKLYRYDLKKNNKKNSGLKTLIRKITYDNDSLIYSGYGQYPVAPITLKYGAKNLRFEYALNSFELTSAHQYKYLLEGFDEDWSAWSNEYKKDYNYLPEGIYSFKVKGRNILGITGEEASHSLTILPPWYRTWWAYLFYVILAGLLLWTFVSWNSRRLQRKNLILEGIVKRRTEEISEKNKMLTHQSFRLKEMDTMKTRLFANISHEFRTPLTLIKGPIDKLEESGGNTISNHNVRMIRRNANRLLNLVNQLLDLSKLDSGKLELNLAEGDVSKCIRAASSSFSSHAASRKMDYQIKVPSNLFWASFDRDKLEKIIYNLLSNAFKFTPDEGRVIIEAELRGNRLQLKVSDTGNGISAEQLPHIFDRFFQVDDSYTKEKAGSGIGLALTKELVELMGGSIYVESELGKGAIFRVVLPMEEIRSSAVEVAVESSLSPFDVTENEEPKNPLNLNSLKVLIIEDNNDMRHFIKEQLESEYTITEASNGKEGLKMVNKTSPDLIVTDLMMPQMDGITLCKQLKTNLATSHIPVIMLTAKAGLENKLHGLETGADDYLTKPFNARELQIRVKNLIAQRQKLRELFSRNMSLDPSEITVTSLDQAFLKQVLELFEENYSDSQFGVPQMQKKLGMSKTALHTKIKALTNHPPGELLRNFRLKRSVQLLLQKGDNISQVAYDVGFNSLSYFTRCFKQYYKAAPSEYKNAQDS